MSPSPRAVTPAAIAVVAFVSTATLAEDMTLPGPSGDCIARAAAQLSIDTANCNGRYPVGSQLYVECVIGAQQAYVGNITYCRNISGVKANALRGGDLRRPGQLKVK